LADGNEDGAETNPGVKLRKLSEEEERMEKEKEERRQRREEERKKVLALFLQTQLSGIYDFKADTLFPMVIVY